MVYPSKYARNAVTGIVEPIEMADNSTEFTKINFTGPILTMPKDGNNVIFSETLTTPTSNNITYIRPGNMCSWELEADISLQVDFLGSLVNEVEMWAEVYFSPADAETQFLDGIEHNHTVGTAENRIVNFFSHHHVGLLAWLWAGRTSGNCERSVSWWAAPQIDWGKPNWLKVITVTGSSMNVHLRLQFNAPAPRNGRTTVRQRFGESPYYTRVFELNEPEVGIGTDYNINWFAPPILRNGTDGTSPLLSTDSYRSVRSDRGQFLMNNWLSPSSLSSDISYLSDSDLRTLNFTSANDVTHNEDFVLDRTNDISFPFGYQMFPYCILRISRSISGDAGTTASGSIKNVKMRVIDPT